MAKELLLIKFTMSAQRPLPFKGRDRVGMGAATNSWGSANGETCR